MDVVTIFKDHAEGLGYTFDYGTKRMLNLLKSDFVQDRIYFLLSSPIKWSTDVSQYGGKGNQIATGNFILAVKSNLDGVIYRQQEQDEADTKYMNNIQPLLAEADSFLDALGGCSNLEVTTWSYIDGYNLLDTNTDGLIVDFVVKET